jgi:hypothetical protein
LFSVSRADFLSEAEEGLQLLASEDPATFLEKSFHCSFGSAGNFLCWRVDAALGRRKEGLPLLLPGTWQLSWRRASTPPAEERVTFFAGTKKVTKEMPFRI